MLLIGCLVLLVAGIAQAFAGGSAFVMNVEAGTVTQGGHGIPLLHKGDWQYGLSMSPSYSTYDAVEMPTAGMHWTTPPSGSGWFFWVSSTTQGGNFAQDGYVYNGDNAYLCISGGSDCIPPNSWGMFWTYIDGSTYIGNGVPAPSGWNAGDHIYFSIAVYPSKGEMSFQFTDTTVGDTLYVWVCGDSAISGQFTGGVGGISEGGSSASFGNIYVDQATLWAESISTGQRVTGNVNVYSTTDAPSNALIYVYPSSAFGEFQVGFNQGTHYSSGQILFSGSDTSA